jgi:class 3 adenylate cyclase/tetratricopeptide (TPR) repeat protein
VSERASSLVTILFTDLVGSTELLSRAGDEEAQRIFRAHHNLLAETAAAHGGAEVKWLGDGLMGAFLSAADALRCAVAMQQASRRPVAGEHLAIRVGLNAGEAFRDESDYFGTPVVVARRLCDSASAGQIICSELVAGLLAGRAGFDFDSLGKLELKGVPQPVAALEVRYGADSAPGLLPRLPFVGREAPLARLIALLGETSAGRGGLIFVAGEPGIGKTRLTEEAAEEARRQGFTVLWGHCLDGEWSPPYAPFAEVLESAASLAESEELQADLGAGASTLAQLVPALRERLPGLSTPTSVQPDEERFRLHDAMAQFLIARARRAALMVCLDDLHWADHSSVAMLRHVVRFAPANRLLVAGTYRDGEIGPGHPLHEALGGLRREVEFERLKLDGLEAEAVTELLEAMAEQDVLRSVASAIATETDGNPFFIKELLRHLLEEGRLVQGVDGAWMSDRPVAELGIPEGVREVIERRLTRLSTNANKLLSAASVFEGEIRLGVVSAVAGLDEDTALDALDEALDAHVVEPAGGVDVYSFTHALIRHTLAEQLSPSRRGRLHLRAAEALADLPGTTPSPARAGEIASQFHRAAGLPGAERGVEPALIAADHADATGATDDAARFLRVALDLLPEGDARRARLLGRLALALAWALHFDEAVTVAEEAATAIATAEGSEAAAEYLSEAAFTCGQAGGQIQAWTLATRGLGYRSTRRDVAWALLVCFEDERRAAADEERPGVPSETPERLESAAILRAARLDPLAPAALEAPARTRSELLASGNLPLQIFNAGEFTVALAALRAETEATLRSGQLFRAARCLSLEAVCSATLGDPDDARRALAEARALADRVGRPNPVALYGQEIMAGFWDEGVEGLTDLVSALLQAAPPPLRWALGFLLAWSARLAAYRNDTDAALEYFSRLLAWVEPAPAWTGGLSLMVNHAAETLWLLERVDEAERVEAVVRHKLVEPDFRGPGVDARLSMARLCSLTGRPEEARSWFAEARTVLQDQGARPLLAVVDYDEALAHVRRAAPGDGERARPLLDAARRQFEALGMTGWIARAEALEQRLA